MTSAIRKFSFRMMRLAMLKGQLVSIPQFVVPELNFDNNCIPGNCADRVLDLELSRKRVYPGERPQVHQEVD